MTEVEQLKSEIIKLRDDRDHWKEHCREVEKVLEEFGIPSQDENGNRIFTENRVRILAENSISQ